LAINSKAIEHKQATCRKIGWSLTLKMVNVVLTLRICTCSPPQHCFARIEWPAIFARAISTSLVKVAPIKSMGAQQHWLYFACNSADFQSLSNPMNSFSTLQYSLNPRLTEVSRTKLVETTRWHQLQWLKARKREQHCGDINCVVVLVCLDASAMGTMSHDPLLLTVQSNGPNFLLQPLGCQPASLRPPLAETHQFPTK